MKYFNKSRTLFSILIISSLYSNAQSYEWAYTCNYSNNSHLVALKKDHAGDIYMATYDDSAGLSLSTRLEKRNPSNTILWSMTFTGNVQIVDIEFNTSNHCMVTGFYQDTLIIGPNVLMSPFINSAFIFETDELGNVTWAKSFNPSGGDGFKPVDMFIDISDNIYLTAQLAGAGPHAFCSFHKLNVWGNPLLDEFCDNSEVRTLSHILADSSGNVYISGTCGNGATFDSLHVSLNSSYQNMLVKYDANFNAQWVISRSYITFDDNNGLGSDGRSLYWSFNEANNGADTIKLVKTNYNGNIQTEVPGPLSSAFFPSITFATDSSGNGLLVSNIYTRLYLFRYDNQFNMTWSDSIAGNISGYPAPCQIDCHDSTFYIGSRYYGDSLYVGSILLQNPNSGTPDYDIFYAKWSYQAPNLVSEIGNNSSLNIFPNPANENLQLNFGNVFDGTISVIDNTGKIVIRKNVRSMEKIFVDLSQLSNGFYFVKAEEKNSSLRFSKLVINR